MSARAWLSLAEVCERLGVSEGRVRVMGSGAMEVKVLQGAVPEWALRGDGDGDGYGYGYGG